MDIVFIKDLLVRGIIGVYDWEREQSQDILININIKTDTYQAGLADDIKNCIDYDVLTKRVKSLVGKSQRFTVEALAEDIANLCLEDPNAISVQIRIEKPGAVESAKSVGVEIVRSQQI